DQESLLGEHHGPPAKGFLVGVNNDWPHVALASGIRGRQLDFLGVAISEAEAGRDQFHPRDDTTRGRRRPCESPPTPAPPDAGVMSSTAFVTLAEATGLLIARETSL